MIYQIFINPFKAGRWKDADITPSERMFYYASFQNIISKLISFQRRSSARNETAKFYTFDLLING